MLTNFYAINEYSKKCDSVTIILSAQGQGMDHPP